MQKKIAVISVPLSEWPCISPKLRYLEIKG